MAIENRVSRRVLLQGVGVSMTLPWFQSLPVWGEDAPSGINAPEFPNRFGVLFMACGVNPDHWWAKETENGMELGKSLSPLEALKPKLNVINGLFNKNATGVGIHPGQTGNILSGASLKKGAELGGGISIDQLLANRLASDTIQSSLVLGCEQPVTGYHETNFSMAYSSHISWQNATSPVPMEVYPALAFDSLFENRGARRNQSVLDRIGEHASDLRRQASMDDRRKLDEFLTSVREVEQRIVQQRLTQEKANAKSDGDLRKLATMARPDNGLPEDIREHMRLMCDIVALAFQTNKTRIATLLLCRDISGLFYPFLDARNAHHSASHNDRSDEFERISTYYCSQYAYLATKLDEMKEGDGTVLDHSCLVFINNMWSGSAHNSQKVPLLTVGGLAGKVKTGRVLDYEKRPDDERKLCSLYLSLADRMGVSVDEFGDADRPLFDW
jgi:hypothetical protein